MLGAPSLVAQGRRALPPLADRVLLAQVAAGSSGYFEPVARTPGFAEALYRLVRELRGAGYELGNLAPLLDGVTDAPEKSGALAALLTEFEARRAGFYGADDALAVADPELLDGVSLLVWGMTELSPVLERLLPAIGERMPVMFFLPDAAAVPDSPAALLRQRLLDAGAGPESAPQPKVAGSALDRVREGLFAPPSEEIGADRSLRLVSAPDPAREARAAARACLAWAADGVPFWDMAIAYRHADPYRPLLEAVLAEAEIPVYLHEGSPLSERPVGRQTLGLLALFETDLSRESVMDFLTDARLPAELHESYGGIPAARWDSISRQAGVVAGAEQWAQRLTVLESDLRGDEDGDPSEWVRERIADAQSLGRFIAELDRRLKAHPGRAPWAAHLSYLEALLASYVAGGAEVVAALRGLERFTALESEVDFARFLDVVRSALATLRSEEVLSGRAGAFARRGVNVLAVNSLTGVEFARVWILGATERAFPPPARQDPILLDEERAAISARAGTPLAPRTVTGAEEELAFALSCDAAREALVVSYARRDTGESRPRLPSIFFREIASQLTGERVSAERAPLLAREDVERIPGDAIGAPIPGGRLAGDPERVSAAAAAAISQSERDRTLLQARITAPLAIATFRRAVPAFDRAFAAEAARAGRRCTEWDGALGPAAMEAIATLIPPTRVFSATALERYATCPQSFLMADVLRIKKVEEPERTFRIDHLHRGSLMHRVFQRFQDEWDGSGAAALALEAEERMRTICEQECDAARERGETGYLAMWQADRLEIVEDCLRWLEVEHADPLTQTLPLGACEARFGARRPGERDGPLWRDEPIEISTGGGEITVAGRIDRIAWDSDPPTRFRVIDYKTGKVREERPAQLQGGRMLQLPLYVLAAAELLDVDPSAGEAAYVYPTRRGGFRTVAWESGQLAQRHEDLLGLLGAMLGAMGRGDFMVAPWKVDSACRYCDFDRVCPMAREAFLRRREDDERLARLSDEIRSVP